MKCINGHDVKKLDKCCRKCGVQIVQQMIKCPSCEEFLNKDLTLHCEKCQTKIVICNGKDGKTCETPLIAQEQDYCHICGSPVQVADELDGFHQNKQATLTKEPLQIIGQEDDSGGNDKQRTDDTKRNKEMVNSRNQQDPSKSEGILEARGLAVICIHTTFKGHTHKLLDRQSGDYDENLMKDIWELYDDCKVLTFRNEKTEFYEKELVKKIEDGFKELNQKKVKYFVFVLSTHGEESPENGMHYQHYFSTKDGQFRTQDLMDKIQDIVGLKERMKLFFIQACRSRATNTELDNKETGFKLSLKLTPEQQMSSFPSKKSKGVDQSDAKGYMPPENEEHNTNDDAEAAKIVISHCDTDAESEALEIPHCNEDSVLETRESQCAEPDTKETQDVEPETEGSEGVQLDTKESEDAKHDTKKISRCDKDADSGTIESQDVEPQTKVIQDAKPGTIESQDDEPQTKESHDAEPDTKESQGAEPQTKVSQGVEPQTKVSQGAEPQTKVSQGAEPQAKVSQGDEPQTKMSHDTELETKKNQHCDNDAELETIHIPHCEDCVVVFGSMAGKETYSKLYNEEEGGGWMIRALHSTLDSFHKEDTVHILDILSGMSRNIREKSIEIFTPGSCDSMHAIQKKCRLSLGVLKKELMEELQKEHVNEESRNKVNELIKILEEIQGKIPFMKNSDKEKNQVLEEILNFKKFFSGTEELLVQLCYFHNLAFEDKYLTLLMTKTKKDSK